MAKELTIFRNGATMSPVFRDINLPKTRLDDGVGGAAWARITYKGKDWAIKHGAKTDKVTRIIDGREEKNPNLDIVILVAAGHPSRRWYEKKDYEEGDNAAPDCYSTMGFKPDLGSSKKQDNGQGCALCPHSGWGTKPGSRGKACSEYKNLAVVLAGDIENKIYGGPMMLSVPPNSLRALAQYQMELEANSMHYSAVHTRVTFGEGLFEFSFDALAALDDVQATQVGKMLNHPLIPRILDEEAVPANEGQPAQLTASIHRLQIPGPKEEAAPAKPALAQEKPALTPQQEEIARLKAQLAAAQKEPEPEPVLTPEQQEIADLKAKLAVAQQLPAQDVAPKRGRPRRTPAVAPTDMDSAEVTKLAGPALPAPVGPAELPAAGNDDPIARINQTLSRASKLI